MPCSSWPRVKCSRNVRESENLEKKWVSSAQKSQDAKGACVWKARLWWRVKSRNGIFSISNRCGDKTSRISIPSLRAHHIRVSWINRVRVLAEKSMRMPAHAEHQQQQQQQLDHSEANEMSDKQPNEPTNGGQQASERAKKRTINIVFRCIVLNCESNVSYITSVCISCDDW